MHWSGKSSSHEGISKGLATLGQGTHCMSLCNTLLPLWTLVSLVRGKLLRVPAYEI